MYPPPYYTNNDPEFMHRVMREHSFAVMSTTANGDIRATHMPFILKTEEGEHGTLYGHIAANNPQVEDLKNGAKALVMFSGPHAYISASWYDDLENRVPTWNYISVQAKGVPAVLPKEDWLSEMELLTQAYEPENAWTISKAKDYVDRLMRGIVYFKIGITDIRGIEKMSQNKRYAENQTVISELNKREEFDTAEAMANAMKDKKI
jgi:transcriptional regulator